jgi:hypothetical protein
MRKPGGALAALFVVVVALGAWRGACIVAGPDIDTDAYAHHMIARAILADPSDLAVHWVWLPLFHYAQVPLVALGGSMDDVRWANVLFAAALSWVLFGYVRRTARAADARTPPDAIALVAAIVAGACPIAMQMGTTAQPEPSFALLVLGVAIAFERRRYRTAAGLLAAAVMLRYEAWAVLAAVAGLLALEPVWRRWRGLPSDSGGRSLGWVVVAGPLLLIFAWAVLRRPVDGHWFGFLRQTQEFATGTFHEPGPFDRGLWAFARDLLYYPIVVPVRVLGPVLWLAPFGVVRTVRQQGGRFVLVFVACLGFVSLSWITRSCLGLDRHFVSVVPLYATFVAQGAAALADWGVRVARGHTTAERSVLAGRSLGSALVLVSLAGLGVELAVWMGFWRASVAQGLPDRATLGAYLRSLPGAPTIFCDDATLEISSGVDRRRFDRHWVDDPETWKRVGAVARTGRAVYVATWRRKLRGHDQDGELVFRAGFDSIDPDATGVAVMRVQADGGRSER